MILVMANHQLDLVRQFASQVLHLQGGAWFTMGLKLRSIGNSYIKRLSRHVSRSMRTGVRRES